MKRQQSWSRAETIEYLLLVFVIGSVFAIGLVVANARRSALADSPPYHVTPRYYIDDTLKTPICFAAFAGWLGTTTAPRESPFTAVPCTEAVLERIAQQAARTP